MLSEKIDFGTKLCSSSLKISPDLTKKHSDLSAIELLDDDSLIEIFGHLCIVDRIRIERVSKRWQDLLKQSWGKLKDLEIKPKFLGLKPIGASNEYPGINEGALEGILRRCGRYLKKIVITLDDFECQLSRIAEYCPNIHTIVCSKVSTEGVEKLTENCKDVSVLHIIDSMSNPFNKDEFAQLLSKSNKFKILDFQRIDDISSQNISLNDMISIKMQSIDILKNVKTTLKITNKCNYMKNFQYFNQIISVRLEATHCHLTLLLLTSINDNAMNNIDDDLSKVFKKHRNINYLVLSCFGFLTGKCFLSLNDCTIQKIDLHRTYNLQKNYLINSLPNFKNLHQLRFYSVCNPVQESSDHVSECISLCSNLIDLYIACEKYPAENLIKSVSTLINLKRLAICSINFSEQNFFSLLRYNLIKLTYLNLSFCQGISKSSLELISKLPNLEAIYVMRLSEVTGSEFADLPNLRKLNCTACINVEEEYLVKLLKCASNLELLDIRKCPKITNSVIDVAVEVTKQRTNNISLLVYVGGTKINIDEVVEIPQLLKVKENY